MGEGKYDLGEFLQNRFVLQLSKGLRNLDSNFSDSPPQNHLIVVGGATRTGPALETVLHVAQDR